MWCERVCVCVCVLFSFSFSYSYSYSLAYTLYRSTPCVSPLVNASTCIPIHTQIDTHIHPYDRDSSEPDRMEPRRFRLQQSRRARVNLLLSLFTPPCTVTFVFHSFLIYFANLRSALCPFHLRAPPCAPPTLRVVRAPPCAPPPACGAVYASR